VSVLTSREIRGWIRSPFLSISFITRPVLWVVVFGGAFNAAFFGATSSQASLGGAPNYFSFLTAGMLSAMPMLLATRAGSSLFADRSTGYLNRLLVAPVSRSTIVIAKIIGTMLFGVTQSIVLLFFAIPFGLVISNFSILAVVASIAGVSLLAWGYACIFMVLSFRVKRWADQQLISSLNFPVMLFSQVFYPSSRLPSWMSGLTEYNPVSFSAKISRTLLFGSNADIADPSVIVAFVVLVAFVLASTVLLLVLTKEWL
jgi:ABC-2 type transport system permease protein